MSGWQDEFRLTVTDGMSLAIGADVDVDGQELCPSDGRSAAAIVLLTKKIIVSPDLQP